ncbi:MAG: hypothetical protein ACI9YL_001649 [Luteibaculaceae bacterium]|jgi:hypothetical protein
MSTLSTHFDLMVISLQKIWPCAERNLTAENSGVDRPEMRTPEVTDGLQKIIESEDPSAEKGIQAHSVIEKKDNHITKIGLPINQKEDHSLKIEKILTLEQEAIRLPIPAKEDKATEAIDLGSIAVLQVTMLEELQTPEAINLVSIADLLGTEVEMVDLTEVKDPVLRINQNATNQETATHLVARNPVLNETTALADATPSTSVQSKVLVQKTTVHLGLESRMPGIKTSPFLKPVLRKFA